MRPLLISCLLLCFNTFFSTFISVKAEENAANSQAKKLPVLFFFNPDCPSCAESKAAVANAEKKFPDKIKVIRYNIYDPQEGTKNLALYLKYLDLFKVDKNETPGTAVFAGRKVLKGAEEISARLFEVIEEEWALGPPKPKKTAAQKPEENPAAATANAQTKPTPSETETKPAEPEKENAEPVKTEPEKEKSADSTEEENADLVKPEPEKEKSAALTYRDAYSHKYEYAAAASVSPVQLLTYTFSRFFL
jgi:thiol-disulfide isomerase/thioredoxin